MIFSLHTIKPFVLTALVLIVAAIAAAPPPLRAQKQQSNALWQTVDKTKLKLNGRETAVPANVPVYRLNQKSLAAILAAAPLEFTDAAKEKTVILEIPTPDAKFARFRIEETLTLAPEVAAQFPTWKTFVGRGIDDPTATASFDFNANGFHAYILGANGTLLIDPYSLTDQKNYVVYYKGALGGSRDNFSCQVKNGSDADLRSFATFASRAFTNGATFRNLKSAWSLTKEYTAFFNNNKTNAFSALQTTVNRMNTIYRRELAVTFTIVSDLRTVFDNANDGGFPPSSDGNVAGKSNNRNGAVLDAVYGQANYDIGHVLSVTPNPNGLAASPSLCSSDPYAPPNSGLTPTTVKAQGFTGAPTPQGDGFDVDYVAHEIGHQFAMSHTFNNDTDGSCGTRSPDSAYEPASGITIMGYGGICAPRNLAANSIEYFNLRSFDQSLDYLQGSQLPSPCGTTTVTNNAPPSFPTAQMSYTIPALTPFTLNATATDANGDALTYLWEEFDLGAATRDGGAVDTDGDGTARPIFRAYNPTTGGSRTFPSLYYILNPASNDPAGSNQPTLTYTGTLPFAPTTGSTNGYVCAANEICARGERLPQITRTMTFRVTARDNNANGGGVADATATVNVVATGSAFQITTQNSFDSTQAPSAPWRAGSTQTVTWDVAGTNANNINAAGVNILLSTDGGQTFPTVLAANTPNDGSEAIVVPNNPTTTARIKVEAVGNIFFDINNANFRILAPTAAEIKIAGRALTATGRAIANALISVTDQNGATRTARTNAFGYYSFSRMAAGQNYVFNVAHKSYSFAPLAASFGESGDDFNFTAN